MTSIRILGYLKRFSNTLQPELKVQCHVNGCGDTLAGVYVTSIVGQLKLTKSDAIKRALTASQISLRSPKNVPDQLPQIINREMA